MTAPGNPMAERARHQMVLDRTRCDHCHANIVWATTVNDARMPVDYVAVPTGNLLVTVDTKAAVLRVATLGTPAARRAHAAQGWPLHQHHKLSCPYADSWSRPGGPKNSAKNRGK